MRGRNRYLDVASWAVTIRLLGVTDADKNRKRFDAVGPVSENQTDAELAASVRSGDAGSFDAIVNRHASRIYTHLYRLVKSRQEAEDLAQETFIRAYRFLDRYDGQRPLVAWLFAIATNVGLNALRTRKRRIPSSDAVTFSHAEEAEASGDDGRVAAMRGELAERVDAAVNRLPGPHAALVQMYYRDGLTLAEAARCLGMSESAAKVTLYRARQRLRQWLLEEEDDG